MSFPSTGNRGFTSMLRFVGLVSLAAVTLPVAAETDWHGIGRNQRGSSLYLDLNSVRVQPGRVSAWIRQEEVAPFPQFQGKNIESSTSLWVVDCPGRRVVIDRKILYDSLGDTLDGFGGGNEPAGKLTDVVPDTVGEMVLTAVCDTVKWSAKAKTVMSTATWSQCATSGDGSTTYFIDTKSVLKEGKHTVRAWFLSRSEELSSLQRLRINCADRRAQSIQTITFGRSDAVGMPWAWDDQIQTEFPPLPGSIYDLEMDAACDQAKLP